MKNIATRLQAYINSMETIHSILVSSHRCLVKKGASKEEIAWASSRKDQLEDVLIGLRMVLKGD